MENIEIENLGGIVEDPRTPEQKAQDFKHADIFGAVPIWKEKTLADLKHYTPRYQFSSLSCCGQGSAKGVETLNGKVMSAHPPYRSRSNYPDGGMYVQNIGEVWKKVGSTLEELDQSQSQNETQLNRPITVETPYKIQGYIQPNSKDIDQIASAIETFGHCMLIFHANGSEWSYKPVYNALNVNFGHCVCAVDYFLENGVKTLYIEDSASLHTSMAPKKIGERFITEDYLKKRCDGAIYFTGVNPLELPYVFKDTLRVGSRGLPVKKLQERLNCPVDGVFGKITLLAVKKFQEAHGLLPDGIVGKLTNLALNK
jgi:hypothetical protein